MFRFVRIRGIFIWSVSFTWRVDFFVVFPIFWLSKKGNLNSNNPIFSFFVSFFASIFYTLRECKSILRVGHLALTFASFLPEFTIRGRVLRGTRNGHLWNKKYYPSRRTCCRVYSYDNPAYKKPPYKNAHGGYIWYVRSRRVYPSTGGDHILVEIFTQ